MSKLGFIGGFGDGPVCKIWRFEEVNDLEHLVPNKLSWV